MTEQKIMTKFTINVIEYDPSGYYYPKYKTTQIVIAETLEKASKIAIERTPWKHRMGSGWKQTARVETSEDIVIEVEKSEEQTK